MGYHMEIFSKKRLRNSSDDLSRDVPKKIKFFSTCKFTRQISPGEMLKLKNLCSKKVFNDLSRAILKFLRNYESHGQCFFPTNFVMFSAKKIRQFLGEKKKL
jgi:hypothetical protein